MTNQSEVHQTDYKPTPKVSNTAFLKDVLSCSLSAYGGPEAHFGIFLDQLVSKRKYLSEEELVELLALCSILPGPTSSQTIVAVGYKLGGPLLALYAMLVWAAPVIIVMGALSFLYIALSSANISADILKFIGPMSVGFIILAAFKITKKVHQDNVTTVLTLFAVVSTYFIRSPWIYPLILVAGGFTTIILSKETNKYNSVKISPPWKYFIAFLIIAVGALGFAQMSEIRLVQLFENFYRYGYLVFGGGQVVVPVMHTELVEVNKYMSNEEFLTGYGLVQGLPGPMFSFAAYAGGLAARGGSAINQVFGALIGGIGIFLPGILLIYFIYPVWEQIKSILAIKISLKGIKAIASGMIITAGIILVQNNGFSTGAIAATLITVLLLQSKKVPAPLIVIGSIVAGVIF